jgi:arylsulfatase A-like enzyme
MKPDKKMNFVFFFPDEMSASSVSCYGNPNVKMPNFDRLAGEGVRFENCIVQNPVCSPSRCSLMTGWYVHNMGHRSLWHLLRPHEPSLFRYLKNGGYDIQWFGKNDLYSQEYLNEICGDIEEKRHGYQSKPSRKYGTVHHTIRSNPYDFADSKYYSFLFDPIAEDDGEALLDENIARAIEYLDSWHEGDKPFMLFLPIVLPHPPYSALARFHNMYNPDLLKDAITMPEYTSGKPSYVELIRKARRLDQLEPEIFAKIHGTYLGMNSYVDFLLGELMNTLEKTGLSDNTTVVVSSDHGDWSGNYGLVEKWPNAMDDDLVRVPLLIKTPGRAAGHIVREQVELFDIMPTLLELAGIQESHTHFAQSLIPQLNGEAGDPNRTVFAEGGYDSQDLRCFEYQPRGNGLMDDHSLYYPKATQQREYPQSVCRTVMIRNLTHKLVMRTSGENELYDLVKDPRECCNVYKDHHYSRVRSDLEAQLLQWYIHTADVVPLDEDYRGFGTRGLW